MRRNAGRMRRYGFALLALGLGAAVASLPAVREGPGSAAIVAFFVVLLSAWHGGAGPGLLATALIALTTAAGPDEPWQVVRMALFVAGGVCISALAEVQHAARRRSDRSRAWLAAVLDSVGDAVVAADDRGRVALFNPAAESLLGRAAGETVGMPLDEILRLVDERTGLPVGNPTGHAAGGGDVVALGDHVAVVPAGGGARPVRGGAAPIRNGEDTALGVVVVMQDDAERRRAEAALVEAGRRKDEFLAMLAHELRNPLAAIQAAVDLLDGAEEGDATWAGEVIGRQVGHLARLLDDLLDVSRITRGRIVLRKQHLDARLAAERAAGTVRPLIDDRGHRLELNLAPEPLGVDADPARLEQILVNLLTNAARYTPPGGRIRLDAGRRGGEVVLRVRDDGDGIAPDVLPRIFDLFAQDERTLGRDKGGLGVGLTIVRALVERHGGVVSAASDGPGRGSEFVVRLPAAEEVPPPGPTPGSGGDRRAPSRILIVDDNRELALSLARKLGRMGHEVDVAYDGPQGVEAALTRRPDVILLDIGLPTLDGYQVASRLRREGRTGGVRIIAISGYGGQEDRRRSREAGMDHHLVKPVDLQTLAELIAGPG